MIRFVFRWAFRVLLLAIVLVIGLLLLKDNIVRSYTEQHLRAETGFDVRIGKMDISLLSPRLTIENFVVYNPAEFGGSIFIDAPEVHLEYSRDQLPFRRLHFKLLRLNLKEIHIVENHGRTNVVDFLHKVSPDTEHSTNGASSEKFSFSGIDLLNLSIGTVRYSNMRRPRQNQEIKLGMQNYLVSNVRSEEDFGNILLKLIFRAGITIYLDDKPKSARQ